MTDILLNMVQIRKLPAMVKEDEIPTWGLKI